MIYNIDQLKFSLKFPLILSPFKRSEGCFLIKGRKKRRAYCIRLNINTLIEKDKK